MGVRQAEHICPNSPILSCVLVEYGYVLSWKHDRGFYWYFQLVSFRVVLKMVCNIILHPPYLHFEATEQPL